MRLNKVVFLFSLASTWLTEQYISQQGPTLPQ